MRNKNPLTKLSIDERIDILTFVICRELHMLQVPIRPSLVVVDGMSPHTIARVQYSHGNIPHEIQMNSDVLAYYEWTSALHSILHEVHHIYAIYNVRYMETLPLGYWYHKGFEKIRRYKWEFDHYESYEKCGLLQYEAQSIERDAESFAKKRMRYYRRRLGYMVDAYLNGRRISSERLLYT